MPTIPPGRTAVRAMILAVLLCVSVPGILMATQNLEPWKIQYLNGIGAESKHQYARALKYFNEARRHQSRPIKNEWFAQYGRHDYDPPYHIARCLLKLGGDPRVIEAWIAASRRGGVTPPEALDRLLDEVHARQGTPLPTKTPTPPSGSNLEDGPTAPVPTPVPPSTPPPGA